MKKSTYNLLLLFTFLGFSLFGCKKMVISQSNIEVIEIEYLAKFPNKIRENSGLIQADSSFWVINDGGNGPFIYNVNPVNGKILDQKFINKAKNKDWEEISFSKNQFFIADFGNNSQNRKNLKFYVVEKDSLFTSDTLEVSRTIDFEYEDQNKSAPKKQSFDSEAFLIVNDSIVIFSKNYSKQDVHAYYLPVDAKDQKARKLANFKSYARITGAALHPSGQYFTLISYTKNHATSYLQIFKKVGPLSNLGSYQNVTLKLPVKAQTEAISHFKDDQFIISSEKGTNLAARSFMVDLKGYLD